jgi:hypothetical protein
VCGLIRNCNSLIWKGLPCGSAKTGTSAAQKQNGRSHPLRRERPFSPFPPGDGGREGFVAEPANSVRSVQAIGLTQKCLTLRNYLSKRCLQFVKKLRGWRRGDLRNYALRNSGRHIQKACYFSWEQRSARKLSSMARNPFADRPD